MHRLRDVMGRPDNLWVHVRVLFEIGRREGVGAGGVN